MMRLGERFSVGTALGIAMVGLVFPGVNAQGSLGIEIPAGDERTLLQVPGGLATYSARIPGIPFSAGIRYQIDLAWITGDMPSAGITHDGLTVSLLSLDASRILPALTVDVFGLQVISDSDGVPGVDFTVLPRDLAFRVFVTPPQEMLAEGTWVVFDLVDTGLPGGSSAVVSVAAVPEAPACTLALGGIAMLGLIRAWKGRW